MVEPIHPLLDPYDRYNAFVGRFITQFSALEHVVRVLLEYHSGMSRQAYRIVVGFPRTAEAVDKLRKLSLHLTLPKDAERDLAAAFTQLAVVTKLRDRVVHYGGHPIDTGEILLRLKPTETSKVTGKAYDTFKQQELLNAERDLFMIKTIFLAYLEVGIKPEFIDGLLATVRGRGAWHYIPPEQRKKTR